MKHDTITPTKAQFKAFEEAYDYFNQVLFHYELPPVILNLSRKSKAMGFVAPFRWKPNNSDDQAKAIHELSINPSILCMTLIDVYSTLVHEQCHIWQYHCGKPSRMTYHNKEWANKMLEVGLTPSHNGKEGGKMIGQSMSDYPTPNGLFLDALHNMPDAYKLPFISIEGERKYQAAQAQQAQGSGTSTPPPKKNKIKYSCPSCNINAWGKPTLNLICGNCNKFLQPFIKI